MGSRIRRTGRIARVAAGMCLAFGVSALAQPDEWRPELVAPSEGVFAPDEPIRLRLPELPLEVLQNLALELDDFDVTEFVSREDSFAVFAPPQPLAYGEHQLRLVEYAADGSIIERGVWQLSVRKTAAFREAGFEAATTLNMLRRISSDDLPQPPPERDQWNGAAQLRGALADGNWRFSGQADVLGNSEETLLPRGVEGGNVDLGYFLLGFENGPVVARAGHHSIGPDSLIMSSFTRRGVSVGLQSAETGASATVFRLRTADVVGFQQGLGIGDDDNQTDGVTVSVRPLDALVLTATYLKGEGPSQDGAVATAVAGDPAPVDGRAASLIADASLLEARLRLRGEYATSRFDFDGDGVDLDSNNTIDATENFPAERDDAYSALVTYLPWHEKIVAGKPLAWNLGMESRRIGTFFRSPANPVGVSDRELLRGFTGVNWSWLDAQVSIGRERDNVEGFDFLPRTETAQNVVALTFSPSPGAPGPDGSLPPAPWYGQPIFNVSYIDVAQDVIRAGSGLPEGDLSALETLSLAASFAYPTWSWSISHTIGESDDFLGFAPDTETVSTQLSANFQFGQRLTLSPLWQVSRTDEGDIPVFFGTLATARRLDTVTAGVSLGYIFTERVNGTFGYNMNRMEASDGSQDMRTSDVTASLAWTVVPARQMRPGLTFALDGQYHDFDDEVLLFNENHYQVFLRAAVSWLPTW